MTGDRKRAASGYAIAIRVNKRLEQVLVEMKDGTWKYAKHPENGEPFTDKIIAQELEVSENTVANVRRTEFGMLHSEPTDAKGYETNRDLLVKILAEVRELRIAFDKLHEELS